MKIGAIPYSVITMENVPKSWKMLPCNSAWKIIEKLMKIGAIPYSVITMENVLKSMENVAL